MMLTHSGPASLPVGAWISTHTGEQYQIVGWRGVSLHLRPYDWADRLLDRLRTLRRLMAPSRTTKS